MSRIFFFQHFINHLHVSSMWRSINTKSIHFSNKITSFLFFFQFLRILWVFFLFSSKNEELWCVRMLLKMKFFLNEMWRKTWEKRTKSIFMNEKKYFFEKKKVDVQSIEWNANKIFLILFKMIFIASNKRKIIMEL